MKITVVVPAYNAEKWVVQCIKNMLRQTWRNLEVIVIDDGSTDGTFALASTFVREGEISVRVLQQENRGLSATRNRGLAEATGDYVHFMDVDDLVSIDFYARMAQAVLDADADMAVCGIVDEMHPYWTHSYPERLLLVSPDDKFGVTNVYSWGYAWRWLCRRSFLLENNLQFEVGKLIEDMPFSMRAVWLAREIVTVPHATYHYKRRTGSILTNRNREFVKRRNADWNTVKEWRDSFAAEHGLQGMKPANVTESTYSLFNIPLFSRTSKDCGRKTMLRFLGLPIWQTRKVRLK